MSPWLRDARISLAAVVTALLGLSLAVGLAGKDAPPAPAVKPVDTGGLPYRRAEVFDFTETPTFRKLAPDRYEIQFASKDYCDVTVAIVDGADQIVRHLISGVLGPNAPEPLLKNRLRQTLPWDGKNDLGRYVEEPERCRVRVSLGLKPVFHKVLLGHPKALTSNIYGLCCDQDGVYLLDSVVPQTATLESWMGMPSRILVYNHQGEYTRQVMPPPADKVTPDEYPLINERIRTGLDLVGWEKGKTPSGQEAEGPPYSVRLPTGRTIITPDGVGAFFRPLAPNSLSVADGMLTAVVHHPAAPPAGGLLQLFRLKTDGSRPAGGYYSPALGRRSGMGPSWLAASADRQWMYLSGQGARSMLFRYGNQTWGYVLRNRKEVADHVVYRIPYDLSKPAEVFLGEKNTPGNDSKHFRFPEGVTGDREGRLYVADHGNHRIQVFSAQGQLLKSLPVSDPYQTAIHPRTGAIYVLSYTAKPTVVTVTKLKSLDDPKVEATLSLRNLQPHHASLLPPFCLDSWAKEPTVWLLAPDDHVQVWTDKGDHFERLRDLAEDLARDGRQPPGSGEVPFANAVYGPLVADPYHPLVCLDPGWRQELALHGYSDERNPWVNSDTGEVFLAPRVTAFGYDGLGYSRHGNAIRRIDTRTGKVVPFDYGDGKDGRVRYIFSSGDGRDVGVSPDGKVALLDRFPPLPGFKIPDVGEATGMPNYMRSKEIQTGDSPADLEKYAARQQYPGRIYANSCAVLLFDATGQLRNHDLIQGLPRQSSGQGLRLDRKGNVYVGIGFPKMADGVEILGNSVCKFGPQGGRIMVNGQGLKVPLKEPPDRPADFVPRYRLENFLGESDPGDKAWAEGMHWSFGGYYSFGRGECICHNARFDLDFFARSYIPEAYRQSVAIVDTNGNFILRLGSYGNADDRGPEVRLGHCRFVAVGNNRLYLNDVPNRRILSIDLRYEREATAALTKN